MSEGLLTLSSG